MNSDSIGAAPASSPSMGAAPPVVMARFMLHLKTHGMVYALGWLILDATGTWALLTGQVATMC